MKLTANLDPKKYKRFFAFGCSMTDYYWSTWADIIGAHVPEYYNWGRSGQGNVFIALSIVEAHKRFTFGPGDLVIPMWSSSTREDRYFNNSWHGGGNIYTNKAYTNAQQKAFIQTADPRFYLIRDLGMISYAATLLETTAADWDFLSMIRPGELEWGQDKIEHTDVEYHHADTYQLLKPSLYDTIAQRTWQTFTNESGDNHPLPLRHLEYLRTIYKQVQVNPAVEHTAAAEHQQWVTKKLQYSTSKPQCGIRTPFNRF